MCSHRSCLSLSFTRRHVSVVRTLVKRETTSKLTKMSLGCRVRFLVISTNWLELDTWCWVRPARGRRILARYRAVLYVGDPLEVTVGRRGTSGLWIFGCPKNLGQDELEVSVELDGKGIGTVESKEFAGNTFLDGWDGVLLEGAV